MKKRKKIILNAVIIFLAIGIFLASLGPLLGVDLYRAITLKSRLNKFIYHTNHQVFLQECRQLIKDGYRGQYIFTWIDKSPDIDKFPSEIRKLDPIYLTVYDQYISIELLGGMSCCRIIAYSDDYEGRQVGGKRIIDSLWLTSDFIHFELWDFNTPAN